MTFDAIAARDAIFVDANVLLYYFTAHPRYGSACQKLLDRIDNKEITGFTSSHVLGEAVHRLMTIEACQRFGWPAKGIAQRLRKHPAEIQQLVRARQAVDEITLIGLDVLPVAKSHTSLAVDLGRQHGLLYGDGLIVAIMQAHGLTLLASTDADFDRVPTITRYRPA
ncbi:MAG TPA: type II toxin-antitoxin system VapC family toxin [Gemmataceae bacterium]|jgi:predicted nucleic acid-binding protein|nr:type II toxin-antitoxin system VapC family toxin [Gemmataceae bacterium]